MQHNESKRGSRGPGNGNKPIVNKNNIPQLVTRSRTNRLASNYESEFDLDTPCKQIAKLKLNSQQQPTKVKSGKLLSTKSLTQLMPRNYFFSKRNSAGGKLEKEKDKKNKTEKDKKLTTTKSYTNGSFESISSNIQDDKMIVNNNQPGLSVINRVGSASMIVEFPRQSTSNSLGYHTDDSSTLTAANLSPIVGSSQNEMIRNVVASTPTLKICPLKVTIGNETDDTKNKHTKEDVDDEKKNEDKGEEKKASKKYKPFKNTALVLRDVKNSIGLRMKAKHESRAFEKLTDELLTPPTKLYSPFNIYSTPSSSAKKEPKTKESKSKRRLNLNKNKKLQTPNDKKNDSGNYSIVEQNCGAQRRSPKGRIALQHKKHLMQANKFAFDSPTGRLRETVKDVEQFQQCIEDISKAIRERSNQPNLI